MALFKIFKGSDSQKITDSTINGYKTPVDGYAYYDTATRLFYIDAEYPVLDNQGQPTNTLQLNRKPINAYKSEISTLALSVEDALSYTDSQHTNHVISIRGNFASGLQFNQTNSNQLELVAHDGTVLTNVTLPETGVTSISAGPGLITNITNNGAITGSGTIKANLKSETSFSIAALNQNETANRIYPVSLDVNNNLCVGVPWTDTQTTVVNNLTTDSAAYALSAAQGKVLQDTKLPLSGYDSTNDKFAMTGSIIPSIDNNVDLGATGTAVTQKRWKDIYAVNLHGTLDHSITIGSKIFDNSTSTTIFASDLGVASALHFVGIINESSSTLTTIPTTTVTLASNNDTVIPSDGYVVLCSNGDEFLWSDGEWHPLGLASSFALHNHTHGNIQSGGTMLTTIDNINSASKAVVTDSNYNITVKDMTVATTDATTSNQPQTPVETYVSDVTQSADGKISVQKIPLVPYVKIAGDTMTGNLTIDKNENPSLLLKNTDMNMGASSLAANEYSSIYFRDTNNQSNAIIQAGQSASSGNTHLYLYARNLNGSNTVSNYLGLISANDGTKTVVVSDPAAWRSAINAVNKAGDTMTGNLTISTANANAADQPKLDIIDNSNTVTVSLRVAQAHTNHGLYSLGYSTDGVTFTSDAKWLVYRDSAGNIHLPGNASTASSAAKLTTARTLTIGSTGKTFDGTANVSWSHADIGATVSNAWTAGTTAGPTIKTTVNGVTGAAVAIPSASTSASGIVTTGAQEFAGIKTIPCVKINANPDSINGSRFKEIWFVQSGGDKAIAGAIQLDAGNVTNISSSAFSFREYSPQATATTTSTGYYEKYSLPTVTTGLTANASYTILTTKNYPDSRYVQKSGDTMTGDLTLKKTTTIANNAPASLLFSVVQSDNNTTSPASIKVYDDLDTAANGTNMVIQSAGNMIIGSGESPGSLYTNAIKGKTANANDTTVGAHTVEFSQTGENLVLTSDGNIYFLTNCGTIANRNLSYLTTNGYLYTTRTYGAVWNDYAEYRRDNEKEKDLQKPGRCVKETGDGILSLTTKRLERGCEIISDTYGFAIGQDEENGYNTPIASSGRVLAYPYELIEEFTSHIGWPVCSGPDGTVSIMTEEEEEKYPSRIIGTISEIPDYEEWGTGKIKINGRVWIRIK